MLFSMQNDYATYFQEQKDIAGDPYICISDFIAPKESNIDDFIGMFAVSAGFGVDKLCAK